LAANEATTVLLATAKEASVSDFENKLKSAIEQALKNILKDPRWRRAKSKWLYYAEIEGQRIGVALATNTKPQFENFALNCEHFERLRKGKSDGKVDQIYLVAIGPNDAGEREYRGHAEANQLYEKRLRHMTPIQGAYVLFWSLEPEDFEDQDAPF
jgi:hypothetical protein